MKVLVFIPIFCPSDVEVGNIESLFDSSASLYFYLNSDCKINFPVGAIVVGDGVNDGLARPFNNCLRYAKENNYEFVLFLDQDTIINISAVISEFILFHDKHGFSDVAAVSAKTDVFQRRPRGKFLINSATFFNVDLITGLGGFNEDYFSDGLDYDICIRIWRSNYKVYDLPCNHHIDHSSIQPGHLVRLFRKNFLVRKYSNNRYHDLNKFYFRALSSTLFRFEFDLFYSVFRSAMIYFLGRLLVKFLG